MSQQKQGTQEAVIRGVGGVSEEKHGCRQQDWFPAHSVEVPKYSFLDTQPGKTKHSSESVNNSRKPFFMLICREDSTCQTCWLSIIYHVVSSSSVLRNLATVIRKARKKPPPVRTKNYIKYGTWNTIARGVQNTEFTKYAVA